MMFKPRKMTEIKSNPKVSAIILFIQKSIGENSFNTIQQSLVRMECQFVISDVSWLKQSINMNGEVPNVPITTLAGITSLTDCK